ncbi:MAG: nucleotidyltransferase domain-containing protein [bacterium]|nr:nucleotidyltransferase domain-containing protein [bacterium]
MNHVKQKLTLSGIIKKYHLLIVVLFGSQAQGNTHKKSDIDIAFLSEKAITPLQEAKLCMDLQTIYSTAPVEVTNLVGVTPLLAYEISQGKVLYQDFPTRFDYFQMQAFKRMVETKRLRQLQYQEVKRYIRTV